MIMERVLPNVNEQDYHKKLGVQTCLIDVLTSHRMLMFELNMSMKNATV